MALRTKLWLKLSLIPSNTGGLSRWCWKIDFMKDCNVDEKIIDCMVTKNCCLCNMQLKCERGRHYLKNSLFVLRWLDSLLKIMSIPFTLWRKLNINIVILNKLYLKTYINPVTVNVFEGWDGDHPSPFHLHFQINAHIQQNGTRKTNIFQIFITRSIMAN